MLRKVGEVDGLLRGAAVVSLDADVDRHPGVRELLAHLLG